MKIKIFYAVIFLCLPVGILVTAAIRRQPSYEGRTALSWFEHMKMAQQSADLDALKHMGKPSVIALQTELKSPKIGDRLKAAWALGQLGDPARIAIPDLVRCLDDKDAVVRAKAIDSLGMLDASGEDVVSKLMEKLGDNDLAVNSSALDLLAKIERKRKDQNLSWVTNEFGYDEVLLKSPSLRVRLAGMDRLVRLPQNDERVAATVKLLFNDTNVFVRERAAALFKNPSGGEASQTHDTTNSVAARLPAK